MEGFNTAATGEFHSPGYHRIYAQRHGRLQTALCKHSQPRQSFLTVLLYRCVGRMVAQGLLHSLLHTRLAKRLPAAGISSEVCEGDYPARHARIERVGLHGLQNGVRHSKQAMLLIRG